MQYSSAADKIHYIDPTSSSQSEYQKSYKYNADDNRGFDNKCLRNCRRFKNLQKHLRLLQLSKKSNNCLENSSTQTWEPWSRTTCVSKSRLKKCNRILICPNSRKHSLENQLCNDGYNRLCKFKERINDREKMYTEAKTSTTYISSKNDGCGVCEALKDRVFAEMGLQTEISSYKIIYCGLGQDQPVIEKLELEKKASKTTPKSGLSPGPSSVIKTSKLKSTKKKTGVNLRVKKSTVKKRSVIKSSKKLSNTGKMINTNSNSSRASKFSKEGKKGRYRITKKLKNLENEGQKVNENLLAETLSVNIVELREEGINENIKAAVEEEKLDNNDKVFAEKIKNGEVKGSTKSEVRSECSIKCRGVPYRRIFDNVESYSATQNSTGSSSQRQLENGSVTITPKVIKPESNIVTRKTTYKVKKISNIKRRRSRQRSSTSKSSEYEDYDSESATKSKKGSDFNSSKNSAGIKTEIDKIRKDKSDAINKSESISTDLSRGKKINTTIHEDRDQDQDQSRSIDDGKLKNRKSPMMIWNWLRERYSTKSASLIGSNDRSMILKDPFLSLFVSCSYGDSEIKSKNYRKLNRVK